MFLKKSSSKLHMNLNREFTRLETFGIAADYSEGIREACNISAKNTTMPERKFVLFLGSTIGNFEYRRSSRISDFIKSEYASR